MQGSHNVEASLQAHNFSVTPRFDFYTDPPSSVGSSMMQFSQSYQGSWSPAMMTPPAHQFHSNYAHGPRMYAAQAPLYNYNSSQQGMPMGNPFPMHQLNCYPSNPPYPNPGFGQMGRPGFSPGQGRGNWTSQIPGPDSRRGGHASHGSGRGRGHQFAGHGINRGRGRSGGGRGRGRGQDNPVRGGGRGRGQSNPVRGGGTLVPERLYNKSMVEDPWKFCQPVKWKSPDVRASCLRTHGSSQPWLPKSISSNTTIVSETCKFRSGPSSSIAASLAASLYETVNENDDKQGT